MRTDERMSRRSFRFSDRWTANEATGTVDPGIDRRLDGTVVVDGRLEVHSLSGHERNHLFLNRAGAAFTDVSLVSGLDSPADGRGFVFWDYDRDGWQDIAVVNANEPLLQLFHNDIGAPGDAAGGGGIVALRFVGGNGSADPSDERFACRDGFGAVAEIDLADGRRLVREHRCGEGYASQNASTMIVGIGSREAARAVTVRWPSSGRSATIRDVPEGTLVTCFEDSARAPGGRPFVEGPYRPASPDEAPPPGGDAFAQESPRIPRALQAAAGTDAGPAPGLNVFITMATWCTACVDHLPQVALVDRLFPDGSIRLVGIPADAAEPADRLREWEARWNPPYDLLADLPGETREEIGRFLAELAGGTAPPVPTTLVTDRGGRVLLVGAGIPPVSVLRKLAAGIRGSSR